MDHLALTVVESDPTPPRQIIMTFVIEFLIHGLHHRPLDDVGRVCAILAGIQEVEYSPNEKSADKGDLRLCLIGVQF